MADNSILTPGYQDTTENPLVPPEPEKYLQIDNYLAEYDSDEEKSVVRENLGVPAKDSVYSKQDTNIEISSKIQEAVQQLLNMEDPYGILPQVVEMISLMVKTDGSTPFTLPQSGADPQTDSHLTTKKYVDQLLRDHLNTNDPHNILRQVQDLLQWYVKSSNVYTKDQVYTINEITRLLGSYIKNDGTTPFRKAQLGVDPELDSHLSTKRYVDKVMLEHKMEIDPHDFLTTLNNRLRVYAKKQDIYDKTQTYSRAQLDSIINKLVDTSVTNGIQDYKDYVASAIKAIYDEHYIKQDGSVPFTNPQKGVDAVDANDLVTLSQLLNLDNKIENINLNWITSGPVEATVGLVEEGTDFPKLVTMQEILDAIFYGQTVSVDCPPYTVITETCPVTVCIHGSTSLVEYAELYQQGEIIYTFTKEQFEDGCVTVDSKPILEDTEFYFKVYYSNGAVHDDTATTKVSLPVFVGLLPKWKFANTITMDYLKELETQDVDGTQNRFIDKGNNTDPIAFTYKFEDADLRHPFIVLPADYPGLVTITTTTQRFGIEAFDVIDMIPLHIDGVENDVIFKIYVYKQALSSLNQEVTYNFE